MRELIGLTWEKTLEICNAKNIKVIKTENISDSKFAYDTELVTRAVLQGDTVYIVTSLFAFGIIND